MQLFLVLQLQKIVKNIFVFKPYFVSRQAIIVKKTDTVIKNATDLKNKKVAVQLGSTGEEAAESILGKNSSNISKDKGGTTFLQVVHGQADAAIGDETTVKKYVASNPSYKLKVIYDDKNFEPEYFGLMFTKIQNTVQHITLL